MNRYKKGADAERKAVNEHIRNGAIFSMRGAGSKCKGKIKIDVVTLYENFLLLEQFKKSKTSYKKEEKEFLLVELPKEVKIKRAFNQV